MTVAVGAALFTALLALMGIFGSPIIRWAAPRLMRTPRAAVAVLSAVLSVWLLGVAAIGPLLAWVTSSSRAVLPGRAGEVCQQCLDAASPLRPGTGVETLIPAIPLLGAPLILIALLLISAMRSYSRRRSTLRVLSQRLSGTATAEIVQGFHVMVVDDPDPVAYALPRRCRAIVVSRRLIEVLSADELSAVLTHEEAHLRQRHHLILSLLESTSRPLRAVPLVRTISDAVPHYLEVAADNTARGHAGTPALASALLKIGEAPKQKAAPAAPGSLALHAAGTDRIRQLVAPHHSPGATASTIAVFTAGLALMTVSAAVHLPYAHAVLSGCFYT